MTDKPSDYDLSSSTILTARFGNESAKLIHLVEKNLYIVIGLIASIAVLSIMNILGILEYFSSTGVDKIVDVILLVVLIGVLVPLVLLLLRSRKVLDNWTDMFERNTIATAMRIAMAKRSKEEAILALTQSVDEIREPLQQYITSKKSDLSEFLDISVDDSRTSPTYDILMDSSQVLNDDDNTSNGKHLRKVLEDYGAVIIRIIDGCVDRRYVESFVDSLTKYISTTKNHVGLAIIIGEDLTLEAKEYVSKFTSSERRRKRLEINHLLLVDKPTFPSSFSSPSLEQGSSSTK
jgi:hypothetical protein